ncbi:MAG: hypothetical protein KDA47_14070 [Planctomycetales bacterium]|nr:hypothetical protein [Planctomycetales bacterium]
MFESVSRHLNGWKPIKHGLIAKPQSETAYFYESFAVSDTDLREIAQVMQQEVQNVVQGAGVSLSANVVANGVGNLNIETLNEFLGYSNTWKKRLSFVSLLALADDGTAGTRVIFHDFGPGWSVAVLAEGGNYEWAKGARDRLVNRVEGTFQWYSWLSTNRFWTRFLAILFLVWASWCIYGISRVACKGAPSLGVVETRTPSGDVVERRSLTPKDIAVDATMRLEFLIAFFMPILIFVLVFVVRPILFPKGMFLIGKGKTRDASLKKWRWAVLASLVFPLTVSLISRLF